MPFRINSGRLGYDWFGDLWERTGVLQAESAPIIMTRPVMPGGLVLPIIPLAQMRDGFLDVEVRT